MELPRPMKARAKKELAASLLRGRGATEATIAACSPVRVPADPREQSLTVLKALWPTAAQLVLGDIYATTPKACSEWVAELNHRPAGEFICINAAIIRQIRREEPS